MTGQNLVGSGLGYGWKNIVFYVYIQNFSEYSRLNVWDLNGKKMLVVPKGPPKNHRGTIEEF